MALKIVTVTIETDAEHAGDIAVDLNGFEGKGCHAIQEAISKFMGGEVLAENKKPEFNKPFTVKRCVTR